MSALGGGDRGDEARVAGRGGTPPECSERIAPGGGVQRVGHRAEDAGTPAGSSRRGNVPLIWVRHAGAMTNDPIFPSAGAALAARERVERLAPDAARDERASGRLAQAALFEEALLGTIRAHAAALRMVAK